MANIIEEGRLGGPQVRIVMVARALNEKVQTTVIMPDENSDVLRQRCDALGVTYKTFYMRPISKEWIGALRYLFLLPLEIRQLARILRKAKYDLVHVSGGSWQYKGVIAAKMARTKVLWHLNDTYMPWVLRRIFGVLSRFADGYIYSSERSRDYYELLVRKSKPEFVVPAPVDTNEFDPARVYAGDENLISQWAGKTVIGTVANINPVKAPDVFIRAASILNKKCVDLVFVVVGSIYKTQRRYFEYLQQLCERLSINNIEFVGARPDVRPLLKRFDIYVCSSRAESSPIAVWEAMSMGKAVVSTNVGDVPLYVQDGRSGFVVDVGDVKDLAARQACLIDNEEMGGGFGRKAREIAVQKLDVRRCARRHLEAYSRISNRRAVVEDQS